MMSILESAARLYSIQLSANKEAISYLLRRGIPNSTAAQFDLGATSDELPMHKLLQQREYAKEQITEAGLAGVDAGGNFIGDTFRNSIIFPIYDIFGRVVTLTGRKYDKSLGPKYMFIPGSKIYDFYGVHLIKDRFCYAPNQVADVFLTEGQVDCLTLHSRGLFALGVLGVNGIRQKMFERLSLFDVVAIAFDSDSAGRKAALSLAANIKHHCPSVREVVFIDLPEGEDCNSFFCSGNSVSDFLSRVVLKEVQPKEFKHSIQAVSPFVASKKAPIINAAKKLDIIAFMRFLNPRLELYKTGSNYKTICPFKDHEETVGSFTLYPENNTYFCFGCGRGGDLIQLVCDLFDVRFNESLNILQKYMEEHGEGITA